MLPWVALHVAVLGHSACCVAFHAGSLQPDCVSRFSWLLQAAAQGCFDSGIATLCTCFPGC